MWISKQYHQKLSCKYLHCQLAIFTRAGMQYHHHQKLTCNFHCHHEKLTCNCHNHYQMSRCNHCVIIRMIYNHQHDHRRWVAIVSLTAGCFCNEHLQNVICIISGWVAMELAQLWSELQSSQLSSLNQHQYQKLSWKQQLPPSINEKLDCNQQHVSKMCPIWQLHWHTLSFNHTTIIGSWVTITSRTIKAELVHTTISKVTYARSETGCKQHNDHKMLTESLALMISLLSLTAQSPLPNMPSLRDGMIFSLLLALLPLPSLTWLSSQTTSPSLPSLSSQQSVPSLPSLWASLPSMSSL